jgi:hypothetical protein
MAGAAVCSEFRSRGREGTKRTKGEFALFILLSFPKKRKEKRKKGSKLSYTRYK